MRLRYWIAALVGLALSMGLEATANAQDASGGEVAANGVRSCVNAGTTACSAQPTEQAASPGGNSNG